MRATQSDSLFDSQPGEAGLSGPSRRHIVTGALAGGLALTGGLTIPRARAQSKPTLTMGVAGTASDAPFFIADRKGFFDDVGLKVEFVNFDSGAKMIAPLATGDLALGGGGTSPALYNAASRSIDIKIIGDKARNSKGYGFTALLVRTALRDKVKSFADLKGMKIAISAPGTSDASLLNNALIQGGLSIKDVELVFLGFGQHVVAFQNGAIDASITSEPSLTAALKNGSAFRLAGADEFSPNFQTAVTLANGALTQKSPELLTRFMKGFLRGARLYRANLVNGHLAGPQAAELISILTSASSIKDPAIYQAITPNDIDPNGEVDLKSLQSIWDYFKDQKLIDGTQKIDGVLDMRFARAAVAELGKV